MIDERRGGRTGAGAEPRAPREPRPTDAGDATRERLIAAGRVVFAENGYEGASVRAITGRAEVNLGAVTYHFGSKENLYHEVIRSVLLPLRERILAIAAAPDPAAARIEAFLRAFLDHVRANPDQPRFMLQQLVKGPSIPPVLLELMGPVFAALHAVVEDGQREGTIEGGPALFHVLSLLAQPVYFMLVTHKAPPGLLRPDPSDPAVRAAMTDHVVRFALGGLAPRELDR